jgi:hypothetical protein
MIRSMHFTVSLNSTRLIEIASETAGNSDTIKIRDNTNELNALF